MKLVRILIIVLLLTLPASAKDMTSAQDEQQSEYTTDNGLLTVTCPANWIARNIPPNPIVLAGVAMSTSEDLLNDGTLAPMQNDAAMSIVLFPTDFATNFDLDLSRTTGEKFLMAFGPLVSNGESQATMGEVESVILESGLDGGYATRSYPDRDGAFFSSRVSEGWLFVNMDVAVGGMSNDMKQIMLDTADSVQIGTGNAPGAVSGCSGSSGDEESNSDTTAEERQVSSGDDESNPDVTIDDEMPLVVITDEELGELRITNVVQWPYIDTTSDNGNVRMWNAGYGEAWLFVDVEVEMPPLQADQPLEITRIVLTDGDGNAYTPYNIGTQVTPTDGVYMWLFFDLENGRRGGGYFFSGNTPSGHVFPPYVSVYDTLILGGQSTIDSLPPGGRGWFIDRYRLPDAPITPVRSFSIAFEVPEDVREWTLQVSRFDEITLPVPVLQGSSERTWGMTVSMTRDQQDVIWESVGLE